MAKGYIHIYTGAGKGKTTAALGLALRAAGAGRRVFFAQFVKKRLAGEQRALARFSEEITFRQYGTGFLRKQKPTEAELATARLGLAEVKEALNSGQYSLVILDEVFAAIRHGLVAAGEILALMTEKPLEIELVLTGRDAGCEFIDRADLVTEMKEVKHYWHQGVKARRGIEF